MKKIPVYEPMLSPKVKEYVLDCLDTNWISSKGKYVDEFERAFQDYTNIKHAVSVCNGTVALHLALLALGVGINDEVIVPTFTYIASVNAIKYVNATPVFVDCNESDWHVSLSEIRNKITSKTKAVIAVHLYGASCDMDGLRQICREHNLKLIEDAAEAFGTLYKNRHVGGFGDVSTFSFFGNKTITTGEGGMVVTNNDNLASTIRKLRGQGLQGTREYWHDVVGYNYRMTNICAAIGYAQLEMADQVIERKRQLAFWYEKYLNGTPVKYFKEFDGVRSSYWMNCIQVENEIVRDELRKYLNNIGVETRPTFYPAHHMPMYKEYAVDSYPVSDYISSIGINLPSSPLLTENDIKYICSHIISFFKG